MLGLVKHEIPFLRDMALRNMPVPLNEAAVAVVVTAMKDNFLPVQAAACELAEKAKSAALARPLLDVLRTTEDQWILQSAFQAAIACGVDRDKVMEAALQRLRAYSRQMNMVILGLLIDASIKTEGGYGYSGREDEASLLPGLQEAWRTFIEANRQELRKGTLFKLAQKPVTPEMFPDISFDRPGKPHWPQHTPPPLTPAQLDYSERQSYDFMNEHVLYRLKEWRETQPKTAAELEKYATELVINLDPPEVLLKDGTGRPRRAGLSTTLTWTVYRLTPEGAQPLKAPVRLKLPGLKSQPNICKEVFVLQGKLEGGRGVFVDITTRDLRFSAGKGVADPAGYQFLAKEYAPTSDSINQSLLIARPVNSSLTNDKLKSGGVR